MARILGEDDNQYILDGPTALTEAADELLSQARRSIRIYSPEMDNHLFDREQPAQALQRMTRSRYTRARILVQDSTPAQQRGHRFIHLAQRFPSFIQLRIVSHEDRVRHDSWVVVDDTGLLYRPDHRRLKDGFLCFHDVSMAPKLARDFDEWWERADSDPELRRLLL